LHAGAVDGEPVTSEEQDLDAPLDPRYAFFVNFEFDDVAERDELAASLSARHRSVPSMLGPPGGEASRGVEMSIADRYRAYAEAFEQSYDDDDWSRIEPYFTEDAVYEGQPEDARGRDAVLAKLKGGVDAFDRRMDSRTPDFQAPSVEEDTLTMKWRVTYTKAGCPDLVISGVETAVFEGDRIRLLRDDFDPEAEKAMGEWMAAHGAALRP
jgi:ketosteroid isomerase-like protein